MKKVLIAVSIMILSTGFTSETETHTQVQSKDWQPNILDLRPQCTPWPECEIPVS